MKFNLKKWLIKLGIKHVPFPKERTVILGEGDNKISYNPNDETFKYKYPKNYICSSRYTLLTFLPKNLFEQFQRIANFYFLCIALIQLFIDSTVPIALNVSPLVFVLLVTMIKQGIEDFDRHMKDREVNNLPVEVVNNGKISNKRSMDICVGDLLICKENTFFPCDILLLGSSDPSGQCCVTTKSLDGETNLKLMLPAPGNDNVHLFQSDVLHHSNDLHATITCGQPNADLYQFAGKIKWASPNVTNSVYPITSQNLLLRDAKLEVTSKILGIAIYTGTDTKLARNSCEKPPKFSSIELQLNNFLGIFLIVLLLAGLLCTILKYTQAATMFRTAFYIPSESAAPWPVVQTFFSFIVLFNYLIPISLYVTIELQKFFGSKFFNCDLQMLYEEPVMDVIDVNESRKGEVTSIFAKANTSDLNEELGQIEFVFTDKTGTLTENEMIFRKCSINGIKYSTDGNNLVQDDNNTPVQLDGTKSLVLEFFVVLGLCHTVHVIRSRKKEEQKPEDFKYQASSPDELAFIEACRNFGLILLDSNDDNQKRLLFCRMNKMIQQYRILNVLEFDSDRKRMSVVVKHEDGKIVLFCKGAESSMISQSFGGTTVDYIMSHVEDYARDGLRTLVIGMRQLSSVEYEELNNQLSEARACIENKLREEMISRAINNAESNLTLLGCTGIEDRLQDDVEVTIRNLKQAGIQVWILTGDKEETAVNISKSTGHFSKDVREIQLTKQTTSTECRNFINSQLEGVACIPGVKYQLIIDGKTLAIIQEDHNDVNLQELCRRAQSVLCCRMTPLQKSAVVRLVKYDPAFDHTPVTLAIGDGANDVSMILEAHVGIGVHGKEGNQAVRAADYSIGRFKFLQRTLLVHGQWYYWRLATLVQYFFYKNSAFIAPQLYYAFYSGFSAQTIYDSFYLILYNITLTTLPIFIYGLFEQHISQEYLMKHPHLYKGLSRNCRLSFSSFFLWNLLGLWHSIVAMFGPVLFLNCNEIITHNGKPLDFFGLGSIILFIIWFTTSLKLCLVTIHFNLSFIISFVIVFVGNGAFFIIYQSFIWNADMTDFYWVWFTTFNEASVWLCIIVCVSISLTPDILYKLIQDDPLITQMINQSVTSSTAFIPTTTENNSRSNLVSAGHSFDNGGFDKDGCWTKKESPSRNNLDTPTSFCYSNPIALDANHY